MFGLYVRYTFYCVTILKAYSRSLYLHFLTIFVHHMSPLSLYNFAVIKMCKFFACSGALVLQRF
jgi:hypothetical protein